jgi:hypothetical protein
MQKPIQYPEKQSFESILMEIKTIAILVPEFVLSVSLAICLPRMGEANGLALWLLKSILSNTCHTDNQLDELYLLYYKKSSFISLFFCLSAYFSVKVRLSICLFRYVCLSLSKSMYF